MHHRSIDRCVPFLVDEFRRRFGSAFGPSRNPDLLVHLGEVDERKLYLECAFPSMFEFCVGELRFSEDAAYNRIMVARAARRLPAVIEAMRSGQVHLSGLRLLAPHLTIDAATVVDAL